MIPKRFRAWDGKEYWYANDNLMFINNYAAKYLHEALGYFKLTDIEQFIGKVDYNKTQIYENDIICNPMIDPDKKFQVIWAHQECGFRKVPLNHDSPITKIDEAFMEVVGTIREN